EDDPQSSRETAILYQFAQRSTGPENVAMLRVGIRHGTKILGANKGVVNDILDWIEHPAGGNVVSSSSSTVSGQITPSLSPRDGPPPQATQDLARGGPNHGV